MQKLMGIALGAALVMGAGSAAAAVTTSIDLTERWNLSGPVGHSANFSVTAGGETVKVRASAWTYSSNGIQSARLGVWDTGLGVEYNGDDSHTIDNSGRYDFVLFQFDQDVEVSLAKLTAYGSDLDLSVAIGSSTSGWASGLGVSEIGALRNTAYSVDNGNIRSGRTYNVDINPDDAQGNLLFVGANFFNTRDRDDYFKLGALTITTIDQPPAVPEPATWAMMIAGFGLVGGAMRRRSRTDLVTA